MKSDFVKALIKDPIGTYRALDERMKRHGSLTPMPEFDPAVTFLKDELAHPEVIEFCQHNAFAEGQRQLVLNALWHVGLEFEVNEYTGGYHQHKPPFTGRLPYQPTLKAIEDGVAFFDNFERSRKRGHDNHYQLDRYRYHGLALPHLSDWITVPTNDPLNLRDLISIRSVPVGLTMVASRTEFIDAYFNSPLNAKIHDDNHNRRFRSENQGYFDRNGIVTDEQKMAVFEDFTHIIQTKVLPSIRIQKDMPEKEKYIRRAMTVLYFEWLHEYAKTPDRESLITELQFQPDGPSAFEVVMRPGETADDIERRRLENKNIDSGAMFTRGEDGCRVHYFMDKGRNFLTSTFNKVRHGFYENPEGSYTVFTDKSYCTPEIFMEAAKRMMASYDIDPLEIGLTDEKILAILNNQSEEDVLGKNLETYPGHNPDDPLNRAPRLVSDKPDTHVQGFVLGMPK